MNPCPTQPSPITPSRRFPATAGLRLNCSMLAADYEKAIAKDKIVVFVRDNENQRLASMLFDYE